MKNARNSFHKRKLILVLTILEIIFVLTSPLIQNTKADDFARLRSWVNIEIPYYGADNILMKMSVVTVGNHLNDGMWIEEISWGDPSVKSVTKNGSTTIIITEQVNVVVGRAVIEAEYSNDSNTTRFTYILSGVQYKIESFGEFPYDRWMIEIKFSTNFKVEIDPRLKYCSTPSQNYYGNYSTTYNGEAEGCYYYITRLEISHPSTFAMYVYYVFFPPIILFTMLALICTIPFFIEIQCAKIRYSIKINLSFRHGDRWKYIKRLRETYIAIFSAVIVFIPVFQLSTQELKTPYTFTCLDLALMILLTWYVLLLIGILIGSHLSFEKSALVQRTSEAASLQP